MKQILFSFFIILFTATAAGADQEKLPLELIQPYPAPKITMAEWKSFHKTVSKDLVGEKTPFDAQQLEVFTDTEKSITYIFTTEGHKAHPAWITRYAFMGNVVYDVANIGYFGGDEIAFKRLFGFQNEITKKISAEMWERQKEERKKKKKKK